MKTVSMKKYQWAVLDADGTLFDTVNLLINYFGQLLYEAFGLKKKEAAQFSLLTAGMPLRQQFKQLLRRRGIAFKDEEINGLVDKMHKYSQDFDARIFDDVVRFLEYLKSNGKQCFMTSGTPTETLLKRLEQKNLRDFFSGVLGSDQVPKGPRHIELFAKETGVSLSEFVSAGCLVGDGPHDMQIAKETGLVAIALVRNKRNRVIEQRMKESGADYIIHSLDDLT